MKAKLAGVFGVKPWQVGVSRDGKNIVATIESADPEDAGKGVAFTFAQMMQLPAIFGTEHIDFGNESGSSHGSSWTGSYGHYNRLVITARLA